MGVSQNSCPHLKMGMTGDTGGTIYALTIHSHALPIHYPYFISALSSPPSPHPCLYLRCIYALSMLCPCGCISKFPSLPHPHLKMGAIDQAYTPHSAPALTSSANGNPKWI